MRDADSSVEEIYFPDSINAATVIQLKPNKIHINNAACIDDRTALHIALCSKKWPVVNGWTFQGDLFHFLIDKALSVVVAETLQSIKGIENIQVFEYFLIQCADSLSESK